MLGTARMALPFRSSDNEQVSRIVARTRTSSEAQRYVQTTLRYASAAIAVGRVRFYEMLSGEQALGRETGLELCASEEARRLGVRAVRGSPGRGPKVVS